MYQNWQMKEWKSIVRLCKQLLPAHNYWYLGFNRDVKDFRVRLDLVCTQPRVSLSLFFCESFEREFLSIITLAMETKERLRLSIYHLPSNCHFVSFDQSQSVSRPEAIGVVAPHWSNNVSLLRWRLRTSRVCVEKKFSHRWTGLVQSSYITKVQDIFESSPRP